MNEPNQLLREIFNEAVEIADARQRAEHLASACGGNAALRRQIDNLLEAHGAAGGFMAKEPSSPTDDSRCAECGGELPPGLPRGLCPRCALQDGSAVFARLKDQIARDNYFVVNSSPALPTAQPGDHIGRYKLLQQIGHGGMGDVFMAEQEEPIRRKVALKVIKLGMDTRSVIARFEAERQALALMDHPNIARVFDAGATDTGRPYFVMELVRGVRITDYCDQHDLTTTARLDLFTQVCHAIQHAHQKGIIHRDIKPSNILVTLHDGVPVPKVIDFGIAKATSDQRLTDKTLFTAFEQFMGTPAYMSPEQAEMSGLDIDTRGDIYSLGVLLYELLTGKTPFDGKELMAAGFEAMVRTIREKEPAKPSTRLSTMADADVTAIAQRRQTEPGKLTKLLSGDLDWIVMKALEKDRMRRYETAVALAQDVSRHLNTEPVLACPPTSLYRFQKLARRNKLAFAAATAVITSLIIGLGVSTWLFFRESAAHRRAVNAELAQQSLLLQAERETANAKQMERFIKTMLDDLASSVAILQDQQTLAETLANGVNRVRNELKDQPPVQARLLGELGMMFSDIKQHAHSEALLREAAALLLPSTNAIHVPVAAGLSFDLGQVLARQARWREAEAELARALILHASVTKAGESNDVRSRMLRELFETQRKQQHFAGAEKTVRELRMLLSPATNDWPNRAWPALALADVLERQDKQTESEGVWREVLAALPVNVTNYNAIFFAAETRFGFASFLIRNGSYAKAEAALFAEADEAIRYDRRWRLADLLIRLARPAHEADPALAERCAAKAESLTRPDLSPPKFQTEEEDLVWLRGHAGSALLARALLSPSLSVEERSRLLDESRPLIEAFLERCEFAGFNDAPYLRDLRDVASVLENLGALTDLLGSTQPELGLRWREHSANLIASIEGCELIDRLSRDGLWPEAEDAARRAVAVERQSPVLRPVPLVRSLRLLATVLREQQKFNDAEMLLVEAFDIAERAPHHSMLQNLTKNALQDLFAAYRESPPRTPRGRELAALFRSQSTYESIRSACVANQLKINQAKKKWARDFSKGPDDVPTAVQLYGPNGYLRQRLECRGGGTYTIGPVKEPPFCSTHGPACNWVPLGAYDFKWTIYTPGDPASERKACRDHLLQLQEAKNYWARENNKRPVDTPERGDIFGPERRIKSDSKCPSGGTYTLGAVDESPRCSVHGAK